MDVSWDSKKRKLRAMGVTMKFHVVLSDSSGFWTEPRGPEPHLSFESGPAS